MKILHWGQFSSQAPPVVPVTNMRYALLRLPGRLLGAKVARESLTKQVNSRPCFGSILYQMVSGVASKVQLAIFQNRYFAMLA